MNNETQKQPIKEKVLSAIKSGQVAMRPRWHFVLKAVLAIAGGIILMLALLSLVSFMIFISRETGAWFVPIFGFRGLHVFLFSLPWLLLFFLIVFILALEMLVRRYEFAYRKPLLYSAFGIVGFVFIGGFVVAQTSFHRRMFLYAEQRRLPIAGPLYRRFGEAPPANVYRGKVTERMPDQFRMKSHREMFQVLITPETRLPYGTDFGDGDVVVVFGDRDGNVIKAFGIRKLDRIEIER